MRFLTFEGDISGMKFPTWSVLFMVVTSSPYPQNVWSTQFWFRPRPAVIWKGYFLSWELDSSAFYMSSGVFNMPSSSIVSHRKKSIQKSLVNFGSCSEPVEGLLHFSLLELDSLCELFQPIKTLNFIMNWEVTFYSTCLHKTESKLSFIIQIISKSNCW
jgi:hypothetical protein